MCIRDRARRKEYWLFVLFYSVLLVLANIIDILIGGVNDDSAMGIFTVITSLGLLLPSVAVGVRRLHDTSRSGWWMLLYILPFVGPIVLLVFFCLAGTIGPNRHGDDPIAQSAD